MASWISKGQLEADLAGLAGKVLGRRRTSPSPGRFRMAIRRMLDSFIGGIGRLWSRGQRRRKRKPKPEVEKKKATFRAGWVLFFGILALASGLIAVGYTRSGLMLLAVDLFYLGMCLHEVRDPGFAYLRRMGRKVATLTPGWYLTIPHLWDIDYRSAAKIVVELGDPKTGGMGMYTKRGVPINVKTRMVYRILEPDLAFLISEEDAEKKLTASAKAKLRAAIGKRYFTGDDRSGRDSLLEEQENIEKEIKDAVGAEARRDGYTVDDIEVYDFDEMFVSKARSDAVYVSEVGEAEARVRGAKVKAVTDNLKTLQGNWPGAVALGLAAGSLIGETKVRGAQEAPKGEEKPSEELKAEGVRAARGFIPFLRNILGLK